MTIPTEPVGSLPRPMRLQEAIAAQYFAIFDDGHHRRLPRLTGVHTCPGGDMDSGSPDVARDIAFAKIANRVEGTQIAAEKLGV